MSNTTTGTSSSASVVSGSTSLTTASSTVVSTTTSSSSTITTSSTLTSVSSVYVPPSTTYVAPSSTPPTVVAVTQTVTSPGTSGSTLPPAVVTITSTKPPATSSTPSTASSVSSTSASSASSTPSALSASGSGSSASSGLGSGAKIAIAVIIPVAVIALGFFLCLFFWRRRKARKVAEAQRKDEMAEYGFNPNNDPTLVPVAAAYVDGGSEAADESGYRGWGNTSTNRKASTTLGSNSRGAAGALAMSDTTSQPGGAQYQHSPSNGTGQGSDRYSADPLVNGHPEGADTMGALGGAAAVGAGAGVGRHRSTNDGLRRGPSNASSAYSNGRPPSDSSAELPGVPGPYYQEEVPYNIYNDAQPNHGPYGDGTYGASNGQPVIRDVQARRNTRIERAPTFPQTQGGIAQNF